MKTLIGNLWKRGWFWLWILALAIVLILEWKLPTSETVCKPQLWYLDPVLSSVLYSIVAAG